MGSRKRLLLLATTTGYQIRSFGAAASALGVDLIFASDRCDQLDDPWWDQAIPIRFHREQASLDAIVAAVAGKRLDAVLAVGDRPTVMAAHVAAALGLPGNPPAAAAAARNKLASRAAFAAAGLLTPTFEAVAIDLDAAALAALAARTAYPAVLKPLALSGSRGVMRVDSPAELTEAFERLRRLLDSPDIRAERDPAHGQAIVEAFVPGVECAVEGVLGCGRFTPFAIFDKPDPLDGPFFEETIYVTPSRQPPAVQDAIVDAVGAAAGALGLWQGPVHAECRVNQLGVYVLEVAARPIGGLCSRALRFVAAPPQRTADADDELGGAAGGGAGEAAGEAATVRLEEVLLRHALGEDVSSYVREPKASAVMMIPIPRRGVFRGASGVDAARRSAGIDEVQITAKPDTVLVPLPEGRSYLGFIFAHAADAEGATRAVREAHAELRFRIDRELGVLGS